MGLKRAGPIGQDMDTFITDTEVRMGIGDTAGKVISVGMVRTTTTGMAEGEIGAVEIIQAAVVEAVVAENRKEEYYWPLLRRRPIFNGEI